MKKAIVILGLLGLVAQSASAQCANPTTPVTGAAAPVYPIAQPVSSSCGTSVVGATIEPVKIQKRHWWQRTRTGYRAVSNQTTGCAAPVAIPACPTGCAAPVAVPACPTGCAAPVAIPACPTGCAAPMAIPVQPACPTGCAVPIVGGAAPVSNLEPVLVPKAHFWEGDRVELMQVCGPKTGAAAPVLMVPTQNPCCPQPAPKAECPSDAGTTIINNMPGPKYEMKETKKTGGASSIRGFW